MGTVSLGKIAFTWRGAYDASATYARQDVVGHHGDSFVCLADATTGVAPHANSPAWDLFAQGTQGVSSLPGEVIYFDGNQLVALPVGQSGQVLTIGAQGVPVWATPRMSRPARMWGMQLSCMGVHVSNCMSSKASST